MSDNEAPQGKPVNLVIKELKVDGLPCVWGFSVEKVKDAQTQDKDLKFIHEWLESAKSPSDDALFLASPSAMFYWINKDSVRIMDSTLYFMKMNSEGWDLILTESLKGEAIRLNPDLPSSGHQGMDRTRKRMKEKFVWYGMMRDVNKYVATCSVCNQNKTTVKYGKFPLTEYHAGAPMDSPCG